MRSLSAQSAILADGRGFRRPSSKAGEIVPNDLTSQKVGNARGREAESPQEIPARGWKDVIWRAWKDTNEKNLSLVAGGVTYYVILALFPGLATLVSIYGLIADAAQVEKQMNALGGVLPDSANQLIGAELHQLVSASSGALSIGVVIGILFALWSASRGISGMILALDIAYDQPERRSFIRFNLVALILTIGFIIGGLVIIAVVAGLPAVFSGMGARSGALWVGLIIEWPLLFVFVMAALAVLYRYAPDRDEPRWQWISPGALTATVLWVIASILFTVYVSHFGSYNKTYGSLGAIIVLLTWLWLSAFIVLFGAEINAEAERQTRRDSTGGAPQPMGRRGAAAADTLGKSTDQ